MSARCTWEPLSIEYLIAARDQARAAGDENALALLREISRLHWVLLRSYQMVEFVISPSGDQTREKALALRELLDKEPLFKKRKEEWNEMRRQLAARN